MKSGRDGCRRGLPLRRVDEGGIESRYRNGRASIRPAFLFGLILVAGGVLLLGWWLRPTTPLPEPVTPAEPAGPTQILPATGVPASDLSPSRNAEKTPSRQTAPSEPDLIRILKDNGESLKARRQAARRLALSASPEAMVALKEVLSDGPPQLKAAIAEGLGNSPNPEARALLTALVNAADEVIARGAIRGWAAMSNAEAVQILNGLIQSGDRSETVRAEAALFLGEMTNQPGAYLALTNAAWQTGNPELAKAILEGLGSRSLDETREFFQTYLSTPGLATELRVAAVEAISSAAGDASPLLLQYASDPDAEVRAEAAGALGSTETTGKFGDQLLLLLQSETDPEVRLNLYQALGNQEQYDVAAVMRMVQQETQMDVRVGGLELLARTCQEKPSPELLAFFEQTGVPVLKDTAVNAKTSYERMLAVMALRQLGTPLGQAALEEIARRSSDRQVIESAGKGFQNQRPR
jgi:HEAT repeat protein